MISAKKIVGIFSLAMVVIWVAGAIILPEPSGPHPPGANHLGINDEEELISSHNQIVKNESIVLNTSIQREDDSDHKTTERIDRTDRQVFRQVEDDAATDRQIYYVNGPNIGGSDYGLEYKREGYSEDDRSELAYSVRGISPDGEFDMEIGVRARSGIEDFEWQLEKTTEASDGWNYSTYNYVGLEDHVDEHPFGDIESAEIVIRSDGLIVRYYARGTDEGSFFVYSSSINVTGRDVVSEPGWTDAAERAEEQEGDGLDLWECGPDDIDGDGDGLCNEW